MNGKDKNYLDIASAFDPDFSVAESLGTSGQQAGLLSFTQEEVNTDKDMGVFQGEPTWQQKLGDATLKMFPPSPGLEPGSEEYIQAEGDIRSWFGLLPQTNTGTVLNAALYGSPLLRQLKFGGARFLRGATAAARTGHHLKGAKYGNILAEESGQVPSFSNSPR
jgi:hypothetical protein